MREKLSFRCRNCCEVTDYATAIRHENRINYFSHHHVADICYRYPIPAQVIVDDFRKSKSTKHATDIETKAAIRIYNLVFGRHHIGNGWVLIDEYGGRSVCCTVDETDDIVLFTPEWMLRRQKVRRMNMIVGYGGYVDGDYSAFQKDMLFAKMFL